MQVCLQHLQRDRHALFQGIRAFIIKMEDSELVIGKIENKYEFVYEKVEAKARLLHLHLK